MKLLCWFGLLICCVLCNTPSVCFAQAAFGGAVPVETPRRMTTLQPDSITCQGDRQTYFFTLPPDAGQTAWAFSPTLSPERPPDDTSLIVSGTIAGNEFVEVSYNSGGQAFNERFEAFLTQAFEVEILGTLQVSCEDRPLSLQGRVTTDFPQPPYVFAWSDTLTGQTLVLQASNIYPANTGDDNKVYLRVTDSRGCSARDSVSFRAPRRVIQDFAPPDTTICRGDEVLIQLPADLLADPEVQLSWADGLPGTSRTLQDTGFYQMRATTECGASLDSFRIDFLPPLPALSGPPDIAICPRNLQSVTLPADTRAQLEGWLWPDGTTDVRYTPQTTGTYSVLLIGECETQNVQFSVRDTAASFHIPNAFTPNGDLLNDVFGVVGGAPLERLEIYNRWGELVAAPSPPEVGWDGSGAPEGLYVYVIEFAENTCVFQLERLQTGSLTLIR